MDIIKATESALKALTDEYAFEINGCIQNQTDPNSLDRFATLLKKYAIVSSQQQVLENIKSQIATVKPESETKKEN
jgi:hypothetical protein